jgi:hypothetical protein
MNGMTLPWPLQGSYRPGGARDARRGGRARGPAAVLLAILLGVAAACAKPRAAIVAPTPPPAPLNVPSPPPHIVTPVTIEPDAPPPAVEPVIPAPAKPAQSQAAKPPAQTASPPTVTPPPPTVDPPPVLQTTRTPDELLARAMNDLQRAKLALSRVVRDRLPLEAQLAYKEAERFVRLAEDAIKEKNFSSAVSNAEKAWTYASALIK